MSNRLISSPACALLAACALLYCTAAFAATTTLSVALDVDNNAGTGCSIATVGGTLTGFEQVLDTVVTTGVNSGQVGAITRRICTSGLFGAPQAVSPGGWPVGLGTGDLAADAIETFLPLADLGGAGPVKLVAYTGADVLIGATTITVQDVAANVPALPIPALTLAGFAALLLLVGVSGAILQRYVRHGGGGFFLLSLLCIGLSSVGVSYAITRDGQIADWAGLTQLGTDPPGDAAAGLDLVSLYAVKDAPNLSIRIDARLARDLAGNLAPVVNAGAAQALVLPATASLNAIVTDDGLPAPPAALTLLWSADSGPAVVDFGNPNAAATTATFAVPGVYVLRMTASDGALAGSGTVQITVSDSGPQFVPIANRTIPVGTLYQQLLVANDANPQDTLTFSLDAAPAGTTLNPSPLIDWTPTAAQLGPHTFAARVVDSNAHAATMNFTVTAVAANRAPVLAGQPDAIVPQGVAFARTLAASDPDGDSVAFALVSGPAGMAIVGASLQWSTTGAIPGEYPVTVKAGDPGGLFDAARFLVRIVAAAAPLAVDDAYAVRLGQTLTVPAAGVLGNDFNPGSGTLSAIKLTDPDKGALNAFSAEGAFAFQAPSTPPGPVFTPVLRHHKDLADSAISAAIMIDLDGDGKPELVHFGFNHVILAVHADSGNTLWRFEGSFFTGCTPYGGAAAFKLAAGDLDDDGKPEVVMPVSCAADGGGDNLRLMALDGQNGSVKWISPVVSAVPVVGDAAGLVAKAVPTIARLHPGESPSVLINVQALNAHRIAVDGIGNPITEPACRLILETVPDGTYQPNPDFPPHYRHCRGVIVLDGADGTLRQRMVAERTLAFELGDGANEGGDMSAPIVVDLDGDGTPEIVAGGVTFNLDGSVRWKGAAAKVLETAVGNFDDTPDIEAVRYERAADGGHSIAVYKADGAVLWRLPVADSTVVSKLTVGDVDGDGRPDIVYSVFSLVCAINHAGAYRWCYDTLVGGVTRVDSRSRYPLFDFDGDGVAEVVVQTNLDMLFLDGATGKLKTSWPITQASTGSALPPPPTQGTSYHPPAPLVGDVDADGHADLAFYWTGNDFSAPARLTVLKALNNDWRAARPVQNQFAYHVANIDDNGTIPVAVPLPNNFAVARTNVFGTQAQVLAPVDPRVHAQTSFTYKANDGALDSPPATVTIDIAPANRPPQFDSTPPTRYFRNDAFTYTAHATDPDIGDSVSYSIVYHLYNGGTCTIGAATGVLSCNVVQTAEALFLIAATDSQGERSLQTLLMSGVNSFSAVPDVVGQAQAVASSTLATSGLATGAITQVSHPAPVGEVVAQIPTAMTSILAGEMVALTVSKGPAPVSVPFLIGQPEPAALSALALAGLMPQVSRQYSSTIPRGEVMAQTPVAGTSVVPVPANPVILVISSGNGLQLALTTSLVNAGGTIGLLPLATDSAGNPAPLPALTYSIAARQLPVSGPTPTVGGTTIATDAGTLGVFTVTAVDAINSRTATADFSVVLPRPADGISSGAVIADFMLTLEDMGAIARQMRLARDASDQPLMASLLAQYVNRWRTVDVARMKLVQPIVLPLGFIPDEAQMAGYGLSPSIDDHLIQQVMRDASADLQVWTAGLRAATTSIVDLNAMADQFATRAARINGLVISEYGGVMNYPETLQLIGHDLPEFYEALTDELAVVAGLPRRTSPHQHFKRAGGVQLKSTLAEVLVEIAVGIVVDKIEDEISKTYKNAKQFARDTLAFAAYNTAVMVLTSHIKQYLYMDDAATIVSGASLSIRSFEIPFAFLEVPSSANKRYLYTTMVIGPTLLTDLATGLAQLVDLLKDAFSYGKDAVTNPNRVKNADDFFRIQDGFKAKVDALIAAGSAVQKKFAERFYQSPAEVINGCVFTNVLPCKQLFYPDGFLSVYEYAPPPGFGGLIGIPAVIIFLVQDQVTGQMFIQLAPFLPTPPPP